MAKPIVDDVLMAVQQDDGKTPIRLSRGSPSRALPRVALDLATTVERIQSVSSQAASRSMGRQAGQAGRAGRQAPFASLAALVAVLPYACLGRLHASPTLLKTGRSYLRSPARSRSLSSCAIVCA